MSILFSSRYIETAETLYQLLKPCLQIPFNNDCSKNSMFTNLNVVGLRMELAQDTNRHVKKTLPPSLSGIAGQMEIGYYVKVTVQRPAFYKENYRQASRPAKLLWLSFYTRLSQSHI